MWRRLVDWWARRREAQRAALASESAVAVETTSDGVIARYPDGKVQSIDWDLLERIVVETNDGGPLATDVWWILEGGGQRCMYPGGATGEQLALDRYGDQLPGFDPEAVVRAMASASNARFVCWERQRVDGMA